MLSCHDDALVLVRAIHLVVPYLYHDIIYLYACKIGYHMNATRMKELDMHLQMMHVKMKREFIMKVCRQHEMI